MRIAIIGGTFNPIHYGHLRSSEEVREALSLERVLFVPAYKPPHKKDGSFITSEHRLEMVRLAVEDSCFFEASDIEIKRGGPSYSITTLRELHKRQPGVEIYFVIGADAFNEITTWYEYENLFKLSNFVVIPRPGYTVKKVEEILPVALADQFCYDGQSGTYVNKYGTSIMYLATTMLAISASDIREMAMEDKSLKYLLPPQVEEYIRSKGLYR